MQHHLNHMILYTVNSRVSLLFFCTPSHLYFYLKKSVPPPSLTVLSGVVCTVSCFDLYTLRPHICICMQLHTCNAQCASIEVVLTNHLSWRPHIPNASSQCAVLAADTALSSPSCSLQTQIKGN